MLTVITGPPCSGKSWHINQHAMPDDITVDLDRLALALTTEGCGHHDYPDHVRTVARAARLAAVDSAVVQHKHGHTVWIIDSAPSPAQHRWYARNGARFHHCTATPDQLAERIAQRPARNQTLINTLPR